MEWFKHRSSGRDDPGLFDLIDKHGRDAYYAFYVIHEIYAQQYNEADNNGVITVSVSWLFRQLNVERSEREVFLNIFNDFRDKEIIYIGQVDDNFNICIPGFIDVASNWVKRKRAGARKVNANPPAEAPLEAPPEAPPAKNRKEEEKKEEEEEKKEEIVSDVIDHLNGKAGTSYRKSARESVNHIKARAKEGASLDDFKLVIDSKVEEWISDSKMCKYLRPSTLFNSEKFWGYLNAAKMAKTITPKPVGGGYRGSGVAI